jgi:hypothetical protein
MRQMVIPKSVRLGWCSIKVKQITRKEMEVILECKLEEEAADGMWDSDTDTIYLVNDDIPMSRIRYTLLHELFHALVDIQDRLLDSWNISERKPEALKPCSAQSSSVARPGPVATQESGSNPILDENKRNGMSSLKVDQTLS